MSYMPQEQVLSIEGSIYKLTLLAAKRAVELSNGAPKLVETNSKKFSTIALEEISAGKVSYKIKKLEDK